MTQQNGRGPRGRAPRWVFGAALVCAGLAAAAGHAASPKPPSHCKARNARPANPNGTVLPQVAPAAAAQGPGAQKAGVMVFGKDGETAPASPPAAASHSAETLVPAPPALAPAAERPGRKLRPISWAPRPSPQTISYRSC